METKVEESSESAQNPQQAAPLVQGSLWHAIWTMSWPLVLTTLASSMVGLTDVSVAKYLGPAAQAAVGVSEQILFVFMVFLMSIAVGTTALVSRATGAGDRETAIRETGQSICFSFGLGLLLTIIALSGARLALSFFTDSLEVVQAGTVYIQNYSFFLIPFSIVCICNAAFRAIGDTKTPLLTVSIMTAVNVAGDYLTVLGNWPVPGLGMIGIAWSGVIASAIGSVIALSRIKASSLGPCLNQLLPIQKESIKKLVRIGFPSALQRMGWALSVFVLFYILGKCPTPDRALASWAIGMRVEGLVFMPLMALSLSVASIVGQNLGAKETQRAYQAGWNVTMIGVLMMTILGTCMFSFAEPLAKAMSHDPTTIEYTMRYLQINALAEPFLALGMVLSGALQGAGDTRTPMWITIFTNWIIRLPLAYYLVIFCGLGPTGAWISMTTSVTIMGLLAAWRFQSRSWMKIRL